MCVHGPLQPLTFEFVRVTTGDRYVLQLLELVMGQGEVGGVTFYRMHVPEGPCTGAAATTDEGCIVAEVFKAATLK